MTTQHLTMQEVFRAEPHNVALPYRSDGVARALQAIFVADVDHLPPDMLSLIATLDGAPVPANGRRSKT